MCTWLTSSRWEQLSISPSSSSRPLSIKIHAFSVKSQLSFYICLREKCVFLWENVMQNRRWKTIFLEHKWAMVWVLTDDQHHATTTLVWKYLSLSKSRSLGTDRGQQWFEIGGLMRPTALNISRAAGNNVVETRPLLFFGEQNQSGMRLLLPPKHVATIQTKNPPWSTTRVWKKSRRQLWSYCNNEDW